MSNPKLELEITEGQIQNAIAVAIAESFSPEKRDALLRDTVRAHLSLKQNSYDKETILSKQVGQQIREYAKEAVKELLEGLKPEIQKITSECLGPQFKESIFEQLKNALAYKTVGAIQINVDLD